MEGFELISKYNERCLQWRAECCKLLSEWALTELNVEPAHQFVKENSALTGFLCARGSTTRELLEAVHNARIEHVALALRYLRDRASTKKPTCNFCTRLAEKGEHVPGCIGAPPPCLKELNYEGLGVLRCSEPQGHSGHHIYRCH